MTKLHLAKDLALPVDAVTQTFAFLARRGAGKTYGATKLAEEMLGAGAQVVPIDPVGVWWGLRLAADGKRKGISIPVFGGLHGDIPLEPAAGAMVADVIVDRGISVVLDVSMMRKGDRKRFVTDFAEQLFHRKKSARSPVHVFLEEAQVFVPQQVKAEEARMLGAFEDLVKLGRNFGIGCTLISQRPQAVNKDALNQTECLVVMQTNGAQERKAIQDWIVEQGLDVGDLVKTLPSLERGEAWVWSPSWLRLTKRVHIGQKWTYNASATPEVGKKTVEPRELAPVDLEKLQESMATVIREAETKDPAALRRKVALLEAELAKRPAAKVEQKRVEIPVLKDGQLARADALIEKIAGQVEALSAIGIELVAAVRLTKAAPPPARVPPVTVHATPMAARVAAAPRRETADGSLPRGERAVLIAAAQHAGGVSREQLTVLTGYKRSSRDSYIQRLRERGFLEVAGERLLATSAGVGALGTDFEPLPTGAALLAHWRARLPTGEAAVLEVLVSAYPEPVDRDRISEATGYQRSSRDTYLQRLRSRELVTDVGRGQVRASELLFSAAAA